MTPSPASTMVAPLVTSFLTSHDASTYFWDSNKGAWYFTLPSDGGTKHHLSYSLCSLPYKHAWLNEVCASMSREELIQALEKKGVSASLEIKQAVDAWIFEANIKDLPETVRLQKRIQRVLLLGVVGAAATEAASKFIVTLMDSHFQRLEIVQESSKKLVKESEEQVSVRQLDLF